MGEEGAAQERQWSSVAWEAGGRLLAEGGEGAVGQEADDAAGGDGRVVERGVVGEAAVDALH